jgi:hypothetical protein
MCSCPGDARVQLAVFDEVNGVGTRKNRLNHAVCVLSPCLVWQRWGTHVLRVYRRHYNEHRPHHALDLIPPDGRDAIPLDGTIRLRRRDLLGGLIHEYEAA